ncbi:hypothetical protein V8E55_005993 [Tylopilus felleus]
MTMKNMLVIGVGKNLPQFLLPPLILAYLLIHLHSHTRSHSSHSFSPSHAHSRTHLPALQKSDPGLLPSTPCTVKGVSTYLWIRAVIQSLIALLGYIHSFHSIARCTLKAYERYGRVGH